MVDFKVERQPIDWKMLKPHQSRGDLLIVDTSLDLVEVGRAIADDQTAKVKEWLNGGMLSRPGVDAITLWETIEEEIFDFVIVKPFVLAQLRAKN